MKTKFLEIRDRVTFIAAMAFKLNPVNESMPVSWLLSRSGYGNRDYIFLMLLDNLRVNYDVYEWDGVRTMMVAHQYITKNFDDLESGDIIDVEYILGETETKKASEFYDIPLY